MHHYLIRKWVLLVFALLLSTQTYSTESVNRTETESTSEYYENAVEYITSGDDKAAAIELANALQETPNHIPARILLGKILLRFGRVQNAENHFERALSLGANLNLVMPSLGNCWLVMEKYDQVLAPMNYAKFAPEVKAKWHVIRGKAFINKHSVIKAFNEFESAHRQSKTLLDAILGMAYSMQLQGNMAAANSYSKQATEMEPNNSEVWKLKGDIALTLGKQNQALEFYNQAIELKQDNYSARNQRLTIYLAINLLEKAQQDISVILKAAPNNHQAMLFQAILLAKQRQNKEANKLLEDINFQLSVLKDIDVFNHANTLLIKGMTYYLQNRYTEALPYLNNYNQQFPFKDSVRQILTKIYFSRKQYNKVLDLYENIKKLNDNSASFVYLFVKAAWLSSSFSMAEQKLQQWIKTSPQLLTKLSRMLAGTLHMQSKPVEAMNLLSGMPSNDITNSDALLFLGYIQLEQKDYTDAEKNALQLLAWYPENPFILNFSCLVYKRMAKFEQAITYCQKAIDIFPKYQPVAVNLALIYLQLKQDDKAQQIFESILAQNPFQIGALRSLAYLAKTKQDWSLAALLTERLVSADIDNYEYKLELAEYYLKLNKEKKALALINQAKKLTLMHPMVYSLRAKAMMQMGDEHGAAKQFKILFSLNTHDKNKLLLIAAEQLKLIDLTDAKATIDFIYDNYAVDFGTHYLLGKYWLLADNAQNCINLLNNKVFLTDNIEGQALLAHCFVKNNQNIAAINIFDQLVNTTDAEQFAIRRFYLQWQQDQSLASKNLSAYRLRHPFSPLTTKILADSFIYIDKDKATALYQELIKLAPEFSVAEVNNNLANLLLDNNNVAALVHAKIAHEADPTNPLIADTYGWLLVKNNRIQQGLTYLRDAYSRSFRNAEVTFHLAITLFKLGRLEEAQKHGNSIMQKQLTSEQQNQLTLLLRIKNI